MDDAGDVLPVWAALRHARSKKARDNNVMHAKPDLRVFLKWMIAGSGSVITDDYEVPGSASVLFACVFAVLLTCSSSTGFVFAQFERRRVRLVWLE